MEVVGLVVLGPNGPVAMDPGPGVLAAVKKALELPKPEPEYSKPAFGYKFVNYD